VVLVLYVSFVTWTTYQEKESIDSIIVKKFTKYYVLKKCIDDLSRAYKIDIKQHKNVGHLWHGANKM
jgi:hypothetical protein